MHTYELINEININKNYKYINEFNTKFNNFLYYYVGLFCYIYLIGLYYFVSKIITKYIYKYVYNYDYVYGIYDNIIHIPYIPHELGNRMKYYEKISQDIITIAPNKPFIVRIDGRAFSNFTTQFDKLTNIPYSLIFKQIMILVANDLLHEFKPSTIYTHSDEIILIFNKQYIKRKDIYTEHIFGGRVTKLLSLIPSFASVVFYKHMRNIKNIDNYFQEQNQYILSNLTQCKNTCKNTPTFNANILVFPEGKEYEIVNYILWRSQGICTRNFIQLYAKKYIGKKYISNINTLERLDILKERGIDLSGNSEYKVDFGLKHGIFIKFNNNDTFKTQFYVFKNIKYSEEMYRFLTEKNNVLNIDNNILIYTSLNYKILFDIVDEHKDIS
jgi:tRNA(His) guanylyltransferase